MKFLLFSYMLTEKSLSKVDDTGKINAKPHESLEKRIHATKYGPNNIKRITVVQAVNEHFHTGVVVDQIIQSLVIAVNGLNCTALQIYSRYFQWSCTMLRK